MKNRQAAGFTLGFTLVLALLALIGCSDKPKAQPKEIYFLHDLPLREGAELSAGEGVLADQIRRREALSYSGLTDLFIEKHQRFFKSATGQSAEMDLSRLSAAAARRLELADLKPLYEKELADLLAPREVDYLESASTVPHIFSVAALQCYSATSLFEIVTRRALTLDQFLESNPVVIFQAGHILPGFMTRDSDHWNLHGIETTATGRAVVHFGPTGELNSPLRVVDANDFMVSEIFQPHMDVLRTDPFVQSVLKATAEKYGIPLDRLEAKIVSSDGQVVATAKQVPSRVKRGHFEPKIINSSPFGFGTASPPSGRIKRHHFDEATVRANGETTFRQAEKILNSGIAPLVIDLDDEAKSETKVLTAQDPEIWVLNRYDRDRGLSFRGLNDQNIWRKSEALILKGQEAKDVLATVERLQKAAADNSFEKPAKFADADYQVLEKLWIRLFADRAKDLESVADLESVSLDFGKNSFTEDVLIYTALEVGWYKDATTTPLKYGPDTVARPIQILHLRGR